MNDEELMTDYQFKSLLKLVLEVLDSSETIEEAKEKIEKIIETK